MMEHIMSKALDIFSFICHIDLDLIVKNNHLNPAVRSRLRILLKFQKRVS